MAGVPCFGRLPTMYGVHTLPSPPQSFDLFGLIIFASSATLTPDVCATQASQPNNIKTSKVLEKLHTGSADRRYDTYTGMQCSVPSKPKQPECSVELRTR